MSDVLMRDLREFRGLIYDVVGEVTAIDENEDQLDLVLDPLDEDVEETSRRAVESLRKLASEGIKPETVALLRAEAELWLSQPETWFEYLCSDAVARLRAMRQEDPDDLLASARSLTVDSLTAAVRDCLNSLIVAVDPDNCEDTETLADILKLEHQSEMLGQRSTSRRRGPGTRWRGRLGSERSWVRLDGDMLVVHEFGSTYELDLRDVVVAGRFAAGELALIDRYGADDMIVPSIYRRGNNLIDTILGQLKPETVRDFSWYDDRPERPAAPNIN